MRFTQFEEDVWSDYRAGVGRQAPGARLPIRIPSGGVPPEMRFPMDSMIADVPDSQMAFTCEAVSVNEFRLRHGRQSVPILWGALQRWLLESGESLAPGRQVVVPRRLARTMIQEALDHVGEEWRRLERDTHYLRLMREGDEAGPLEPVIGAMSAIQAATNRIRAREEQLRRALESAADERQILQSAA